jgi:hypothetical protein
LFLLGFVVLFAPAVVSILYRFVAILTRWPVAPLAQRPEARQYYSHKLYLVLLSIYVAISVEIHWF